MLMCSVGWAAAAYVKALSVSGDVPLFPQAMSAKTMRMLRNYTFLVWYLCTRLYFTSFTANNSTLKRLAKRQHHGARLSAFAMLLLLQCGVDEAVHLLCRVLGEVKAELLGIPILAPGDICCICQDETRGRSLFNFCQGCTQHLAHWDCMSTWHGSNAQLANCCPLCREPLRLHATLLETRVMVNFLSSEYWAGVLQRCLLNGACLSGMVILTRLSKLLAAVRQSFRPGYARAAISAQ